MSHLTTWSVLKSLGFKDDKEVISDPPGGLSFHFDNFKLSASVCTNLRAQPIILFSGVYATGRTLGKSSSRCQEKSNRLNRQPLGWPGPWTDK